MTDNIKMPDLPRHVGLLGLPGDSIRGYAYSADQMREFARAAILADRAAGRASAEPEGLSLAQEPKYTVNGSAIVNRASGEAIPADEPVFIFRARDKHAIEVLEFYRDIVSGSEHREAIDRRTGHFYVFRANHPERMKEPDTDPTPTASIAPKADDFSGIQPPMRHIPGVSVDVLRRAAEANSGAPKAGGDAFTVTAGVCLQTICTANAAPVAQAAAGAQDWRYMSLQAKVRDLLHLLSFADIKTPTHGDAEEAARVMANIRNFINSEPPEADADRASGGGV